MSLANFFFGGGLSGEDPYAGLENQLKTWQGAVQYQPGMDYSNYAFARPYATNEGPQAGSWMVPKDVYNRMSPQTSGGNFFSDLPQAFNDMKGGALVAGGGPLAGAGITALAGPGSLAALGETAGAASAGGEALFGPATGTIEAPGLQASGAYTSAAAGSGYPIASQLSLGGLGTAAALGGAGSAAGTAGGAAASAAGGLLGNSALLGAALGAGAGLLGGSKPAGTVQTTDAPWGPQQPYLQSLFPYATSNLTGTLSGNYLTPDSNPYLKSYGQALADQVGATVDSRFEGAGRYGSGAHAGEVAKQVGNTLAGLYGNAYTNERNLQNTAATGLMSKNFGSTATQPYFTNPIGGALSGALAGGQLGKWWG